MTTAKQRLLEYKNQSEPDDYELYELKEALAAIQADLLAIVNRVYPDGPISIKDAEKAQALGQAIREYTATHQEESKGE